MTISGPAITYAQATIAELRGLSMRPSESQTAILPCAWGRTNDEGTGVRNTCSTMNLYTQHVTTCHLSINQSFICETNINRQDSDARQYTSFTGFQGRKASTDRNPLNKLLLLILLFLLLLLSLSRPQRWTAPAVLSVGKGEAYYHYQGLSAGRLLLSSP